MPYKLIDPAPGRSPYYRVRGTEYGVYLDRSTSTRDRKTAQKFLTQWKEDAKRAALQGGRKPEATFASASLAYMQADRPTRFLAPLIEHFGETPLSEIGQAEIDAAAVALYPDAQPSTRNRQVYSPVSAILRHAGISLPLRRPQGSAGNRRVRWLTPKEAFALLKSAKEAHERFGALLTFLLYSGVRLSEALRLTWADVDLARASAVIGRTKNGSPVTVHLPPDALAALKAIDSREGKVFRLTKSGRLYTLLRDARERSGVDLPDRTAFHILRHTHATWRRRFTGADTSALMATGLWKSANSARVYEHLDVSEEARKSDLLPRATRAKIARKSRKGAENL